MGWNPISIAPSIFETIIRIGELVHYLLCCTESLCQGVSWAVFEMFHSIITRLELVKCEIFTSCLELIVDETKSSLQGAPKCFWVLVPLEEFKVPYHEKIQVNDDMKTFAVGSGCALFWCLLIPWYLLRTESANNKQGRGAKWYKRKFHSQRQKYIVTTK